MFLRANYQCFYVNMEGSRNNHRTKMDQRNTLVSKKSAVVKIDSYQSTNRLQPQVTFGAIGKKWRKNDQRRFSFSVLIWMGGGGCGG